MVKRIVSMAFIFLFILSLATSAYCDDPLKKLDNPLKKLGRGACNLITFPFELFHQISDINNIEGPFAGITYGVIKGVAMSGIRALVGAYEVATFPIPFPKEYKPILTDPEFFFEQETW